MRVHICRLLSSIWFFESTRDKLTLWHLVIFMGVLKTPLESRFRSKQGERKHIRSREQGKYSAKMRTNKNDWEDQRAGRRQEITNVSVGHMWIPRGLIRLSGAPDIRHRKPREIVPQELADASIKTRWCYYSGAPALHNFHSLSRSSQYSSS